MADDDSFDDRFNAFNTPNQPLSDEDIDYLLGRKPVSKPIPGIANPSIPGIRGVWTPDMPDTATPDFSLKRANEGKSVAPWAFSDPLSGLTTGGQPQSGSVKEFLRDKAAREMPPVQGLDDEHLPQAPMRTGPGPNEPMNGGLQPTPTIPPFGPGVAAGPMGVANPGGPQPQPAPPIQGQPQQVAPPQPAPQPSPQPPQPARTGPQPGAPELDHSIIPQDSLLGRIFNGFKQQNPVLGPIGGISDWIKDNRSTLMAMGGGLAGSQSWGQGLGRAMTAAVPAMQADIAQQNQNQTASLLMQKMPGLTSQQARAIAGNKEIMSQLVPQLFGAKQLQHIQYQDAMGNTQLLTFNPSTGKYYDVSGRELGAGGGGMPNSGGATADMHGEEYLKASGFNSEMQNKIRGIVEGRLAYPTGAYLRSPEGRAVSNGVVQYDPEFDQFNANARNSAYKYWMGGSGQGGATLGRLGQLAEHAESLAEAVDAQTNQGSIRAWNAAKNMWEEQTGTGTGSQRVSEKMHALADEFSSLWKAGHPTDHEIRSWEENFPKNGSKLQQKAYIKDGLDLVQGAQNQLVERRNRELGSVATSRLPPAVDPKLQERLDRVKAWATSGEGETLRGRDLPAAPKPGDVQKGYRFKGGDPSRESNWEKVK